MTVTSNQQLELKELLKHTFNFWSRYFDINDVLMGYTFTLHNNWVRWPQNVTYCFILWGWKSTKIHIRKNITMCHLFESVIQYGNYFWEIQLLLINNSANGLYQIIARHILFSKYCCLLPLLCSLFQLQDRPLDLHNT